ncbi:SIMPL domain-containing protein [uncultured Bacteroides sp.]|uniref:SIMPL domain-containing protein n=1 Tax=uncultured Bacteroides sp. TaxID=162156 RepID=UPI002AABA16A|nr:SIMPL domain-containing protein [uncultured Bacteroides sp.]
MKHWRIEALLIAIGLFFIGYQIKKGITEFKDKERIVSVKGLAEVEVPADKVIWPLMYKEIGNDLITLYNTINAKNQLIITFLKKNGITANEISQAPPEIVDMKAERYSSNPPLYRYNATSGITVTSKNVQKVRKLMTEQTELLKQGIAIATGDYRYNVVYEFTGLNKIKPQMIEEATKNARIAANKFAHDSESELGKIRNASQGQFSISNRDANTPFIKYIRVVTTVNYYLKN